MKGGEGRGISVVVVVVVVILGLFPSVRFSGLDYGLSWRVRTVLFSAFVSFSQILDCFRQMRQLGWARRLFHVSSLLTF